MTAGNEQLVDVLALLCVSAAWFIAGVCWAAYRALSWVESIRKWADDVAIAEQEIDAMGVE